MIAGIRTSCGARRCDEAPPRRRRRGGDLRPLHGTPRASEPRARAAGARTDTTSHARAREGTRALHGAAALRERRATLLRLTKALTHIIPTAAKKLRWRDATLPTIQPTFLNTTRVAARCSSLDAPFETQLERVVREILRRTRVNEVVFTIVDQAYGDLLEANFEMARKAGFSDGLFYVSLDRSTAEDACSKRKRVAFLAKPRTATTKDVVYLGKYYAAMLLCKARIRFFFWEMDLWLPPRLSGPSVVDVFRAAAATDTAGPNPGSAWALHEDNPYTINIGLYYIASDTDGRSYDLFDTLLDYLRRHPHAFDQGLVNCVLKKVISHQRINYIKDRDNCKVDGFDTDERRPSRRRSLAVINTKDATGQDDGHGQLQLYARRWRRGRVVCAAVFLPGHARGPRAVLGSSVVVRRQEGRGEGAHAVGR